MRRAASRNQLVADPEDGRDPLRSDLAAQVLDVRVDRAIEAVEVVAEGETRQLLAPEDPAGIARQDEQQTELRRRDRNRFLAHSHITAVGIDRERANAARLVRDEAN